MHELEDTIESMLSADYKERLKAEYYQVCIRFNKLGEYLKSREDIQDRELLAQQARYMLGYRNILALRLAHIGIDIS